MIGHAAHLHPGHDHVGHDHVGHDHVGHDHPGHGHIAATVDGEPVTIAEVDALEADLRASPQTAALPRPGTSEGRQLRRWLTQLLVTERVVVSEARRLGIDVGPGTPSEAQLLPDLTARLEIGSIAANVLARPLARAVYANVTADVDVDEQTVADYHRRNPNRFGRSPELGQVSTAIAELLRGAARRRAFRTWLDRRRAELTWLAPGYEHPGDPRQPDNTHKH